MFIGHYGIGFGAKSVAPKTSLGTLFLAAQFSDLLCPSLLLLGVEKVRITPGTTKANPLDFEYYPVSHSLLAVIGWALLVATVYQFVKRDPRGAVVLGLLVVSHWFLDLIVHRPDLQIIPGSPYTVGFSLWNSLPGTMVVELLIFFSGLGVYLRNTSSKDAVGTWALWVLVAFLVITYLGSLFGTPPPNVTVLAWVGQSQWLLIVWGYWISSHRRSLK